MVDEDPGEDRGRHSRDVGQSARRGVMATSVGQAITQLGSMAATIILARLLSPSDFGLIAVAQSIMGAGTLISLAGLNASLVTRRGAIDSLGTTYFWLSLSLGAAFAGLMATLAAPVATLVGVPEAAPLVALLAVALPFNLAVLVPQALLQRQLAFTRLNIALVAPAVLYFVSEVVLVLMGWGARGVIAAQVASAVFGTILALRLARWLPRHGFAPSGIRQDLRVLGGVSATQVMSYIYKNIDYWMVGRALGTNAVGAYYVAYVLPNIVRLRLTSTYTTIMLPVLSTAETIQEAKDRWRQATTVMLFISVPLLVGTAAIGEPLVQLFFGPKWSSAIAPMQILVVGTIIDVLWAAASTMALAQKRMGNYTIAFGVRLIATAAAIVVALTISRSIAAVAWAVVSGGLLALVVQDRLVGRPLGIGLTTISGAIVRIGSACCLMAIAIHLTLESVDDLPLWAQVFLGVAIGAAAYLTSSVLISRGFTTLMLRHVRDIILSSRAKTL